MGRKDRYREDADSSKDGESATEPDAKSGHSSEHSSEHSNEHEG